ncbi:MAG: hypothetical protein M0R74_03485, partial [Dehalococcoidia bacterium]|nr:hypothetical protein [Dehalococcoidia bacterium]
MAARTRTRTRASRSSRRGKSFLKRKQLLRPEVVGLAAAVAAVASLPFLVDMGEVGTRGRDWLVGTAGLGIFILAALSVLGGIAISHRAYDNPALFARRAVGAVALALFFWGALGLNRADWQTGGVDFHEVTLGGDVGRALVSNTLAKLAWLSLFVIGMALLAPRTT